MQIELDLLKKLLGIGVNVGVSAIQRNLRCGFNHADALMHYALDSGQARQVGGSSAIEFI